MEAKEFDVSILGAVMHFSVLAYDTQSIRLACHRTLSYLLYPRLKDMAAGQVAASRGSTSTACTVQSVLEIDPVYAL